jgi:hypothetical protein
MADGGSERCVGWMEAAGVQSVRAVWKIVLV